MFNINFKYHTDEDYILVRFYDANQELIKPLDCLTKLDTDTDTVWLRRLRNGLLSNISQFNRRVEANIHIKTLSLVDAVLYLFKLNNVRNAKTGIKIKASMPNVN